MAKRECGAWSAGWRSRQIPEATSFDLKSSDFTGMEDIRCFGIRSAITSLNHTLCFGVRHYCTAVPFASSLARANVLPLFPVSFFSTVLLWISYCFKMQTLEARRKS
eukprot:IDg21904t1